MTKKLVFLLFVLVSSLARDQALLAEPATRQESSEELFLASPGSQALKEKKYDTALSEIERLTALRPKDPYLLKMKGFLLSKMGREAEGREFLEQALRMNPLDRQARFYLARSYMRDRNPQEARTQLRFLIENPDELGYYEDKAQRALAVIEGRPAVRPAKKKEEKKWKVFGTYGYEYDDNVALQTTEKTFKIRADRNADRFSFRQGVGYDFIREQTKKAGMSYTFSQSLHTDSMKHFNFRNHSLQTYGTYFTEILDRPVTMGLRHTFSHGTLQSRTFSSANSILPWISSEPVENIVLSVYNHFSHINFRNEGFNVRISGRDGFYNTTGTMVTILFFERKSSLSASYEFGYNQTEGDNFDARIHGVRTVLKTPLFEKIKGEASFAVLDDKHYNFASQPNREDIHYVLGTKLIRPIAKYVELRALYSFTNVKNTHAGVLGHFQYSRHIVGGEVSFSY